LARPGGNVTGLSIRSTDLASKRLELQREIVPRLRRVAIMANVGFPEAALEMRESQHTARKLGLEVAPHEIERAEDIAPAFDVLKTQADALYVVGDALLASTPRVSLDARLPTTFNGHFFVEAGGLMSYGPNYPVLFQRAAELVDHILRGTRPGDIPIEQPTKFELVVNLKTANALGLEIPLTIFASAGQVIE